MHDNAPVNYQTEIPEVLEAMAGVHQAMDGGLPDRTLLDLVQLRASQQNGCAFCVRMHLREAREHGEKPERLDAVVVWRHARSFSERERAALAWTEALTALDPRADLGALREQLREHFSDREIGVLTASIAMINLWNRLHVSRH